jgi:hypothetical protein
MFGLSRGTPAGGALVPVQLEDAPGTLHTEHAHGRDSGSGRVPTGAPIQTDPDSGGRTDDLGHHPILTGPQGASDLYRIPGQVTRELFGGVRVAHHSRLLHEAPAFDGRHVELAHRQAIVVLAPHESMSPEAGPTLPSLRVPPVSDPYGRMCNNLGARAEGGR